jgi:two-component system cell cycle sensor histidine kinase/response regulator CckA
VGRLPIGAWTVSIEDHRIAFASEAEAPSILPPLSSSAPRGPERAPTIGGRVVRFRGEESVSGVYGTGFEAESGGAAVLVADEDFSIRHVLEECLLEAGHFPLLVHRGDEVLERLEHVMPDALVLDHALAGINGLELVRAVRAQPSLTHLPIIMLTAQDDMALRLAALQAGADDILTKPFEPLELQTRLRNLLRLKSFREELQRKNLTLEEEVERRTAEVRRQSSLVEELADAIISTDAEFKILTWNRGAEALYGRPRETAVKQSLWEALPSGLGEREVAEVRAALERRGRWSAELAQRTADGRQIWAQTSLTALRDERGRTTGYAVVAHDLTEVRQARAVLAEAEARGHEARKMEALGRLTRGIAHDFNNYLGIVLSYTVLAQEESDAGRTPRNDLEMVLEAARTASELSKQLLAFSKRQPMEPVPADLNRIIAKLRQLFGRVIGDAIEVSLDLAPRLPEVVVDVVCMEQVLMNLVVNARDAMPRGGVLSLRTAPVCLLGAEARAQELAAGDYVRVSVRDTGVGMDEATRSRVFEPFFSTKGERGTGLGLATVYGLVRQSGGQISVQSQPGQGTEFEILLPVRASAAPAPSAPKAKPAPRIPTLTGKRVLLAEDEPAIRQMMRRVLAPTGAEVEDAASGPEALAALERARPDLLITDVSMPLMSGWELARQARAVWPGLPVLFTTGDHADLDDRGAPVQAVLHKPFYPKELVGWLERLLVPSP